MSAPTSTSKIWLAALLAPAFVAIILLASLVPPRRVPLVGLVEGATDSDPSHPHVDLVQKDASFRPIAGARGRVDYAPDGNALTVRLRAAALKPGLRYLIELNVDGTTYAIASRAADARGRLALDTTLMQFAEGACVGPNYDAPEPLAGRHVIKFWVKRDGNPRAGTSASAAPGSAGARLPCTGNGDGDYTYVLLEQSPAIFTGRR